MDYMKLYKLHDAWILKRQKSQVNSLFGAIPRDALRMHKCIKSDISFDLEKIFYYGYIPVKMYGPLAC